jgi:PilZ domain
MSSSGTPTSSGPFREQRAVPRYSLIATVDVFESATEMRLSGRVSEISRKGCYVDILNTLPVGTAVQLSVSRDQGNFVTAGKVIYVHEGMGMGVAFLDPAADQLKTLDAWLSEMAS